MGERITTTRVCELWEMVTPPLDEVRLALADLTGERAALARISSEAEGLRTIIRNVSEALNGGESEPDLLAADVSALGQRYAATMADLSAARAQIAALTAAQGVTVEAHARAVREAFIAWAPLGEWACDETPARRDLLATLRAAGVPDAQAAALVDGEVSGG